MVVTVVAAIVTAITALVIKEGCWLAEERALLHMCMAGTLGLVFFLTS